MPPMPTEWWLRPVSSAWRDGEHNAVVWKRVNFNPCLARRSNVGVAHGPPNALDEPKPASSSMITRTFGAPFGGRSGSIGGNAVAGSLASYVTSPACCRSGIGRTLRGTSDEDTEDTSVAVALCVAGFGAASGRGRPAARGARRLCWMRTSLPPPGGGGGGVGR